jgi:hypothetical protein
VLTLLVSRWFALLALLAGANQWLYALTGSCPASLILRRTCRFDPATLPTATAPPPRTTEMTVPEGTRPAFWRAISAATR